MKSGYSQNHRLSRWLEPALEGPLADISRRAEIFPPAFRALQPVNGQLTLYSSHFLTLDFYCVSLRSMLEAKAFLRGTSTGRAGGFRNNKKAAAICYSLFVRIKGINPTVIE